MTNTMPTQADITNEVTIGVPDVPVGNGISVMSGPTREYDVIAKPGSEYVAGGNFLPLGNYVRTLPKWIDPTQRDFGLDIYQRMVDSDPQVASCIEVYKADVLADGWRIAPAKDVDGGRARGNQIGDGVKPKRTSSPEAIEAADFCRYCLVSMETTPFDLFLRQMLDGIYQGHKLAEKVCKVETQGRWAGDLVLDRIKVKPQRSTAFVMDAYDNLLGIMGLMPNVPFYGTYQAFGFVGSNGLVLFPGEERDSLQKNAPALLPRDKFCLFVFDGIDGSPQGRSVLRRAFTPWWWKENCYAIWGKYITKHADPSIVGTAAPDAVGKTPAINADGTPVLDGAGDPIMLDGQQQMGRILSQFQNGSFIGIPHGATIEAIAVANNGEAISMFFDSCNKEIAKAILGQTLATEEGKHASRAQAGVHAMSKDDVTRYGQVLLTRMVIMDILWMLVKFKYGEGAKHLIPEFGLGQEETMSYADFASGTAGLVTSGFLHESQYPALDEMGGLPPRDIEAWKADQDAKKEAAKAATIPPANPGTVPRGTDTK